MQPNLQMKMINQKRGFQVSKNKEIASALLSPQSSKLLQNGKQVQTSACSRCTILENSLQEMTEMNKQLELDNDNLSKMIWGLQNQNQSMLKQHNKLNMECTELMERLNEQLEIRDSMIYSYQHKIDELSHIIEERQAEEENKMQQEVVSLQKQTKQQKLSFGQQANRQRQIEQLKNSEQKLKHKNSQCQRQKLNMLQQHQSEIFSLQAQAKQLESLLESKQELIKSFSNDNDRLRLELLDLKSKIEIGQIASYMETSSRLYSGIGDDKHSWENEELKEEIQELKDENSRKRKEIKHLKSVLALQQREQDYLPHRLDMPRDQSFDVGKRGATFIGRMRRQLPQRNMSELYQALESKLIRVYQLCSLERSGNDLVLSKPTMIMSFEWEPTDLSRLLLVADKIIELLESNPHKQFNPQISELEKQMITQNLLIQSNSSSSRDNQHGSTFADSKPH